MKIHSFLGLFPSFPDDVLQELKITGFQICIVVLNLSVEQNSIILQTKNFPIRLHQIKKKYWLEKAGDDFTQSEELKALLRMTMQHLKR